MIVLLKKLKKPSAIDFFNVAPLQVLSNDRKHVVVVENDNEEKNMEKENDVVGESSDESEMKEKKKK